MGIKLSQDPLEPVIVAVKEDFSLSFLNLLSGMLTALRTVFLPHLAAMSVLLLLAGIGFYKLFAAAGGGLTPLGWICFLGALILYGSFCLGYTILMSLVFGVKVIAGYVEDFFYKLFANLKAKALSKIEDMEEGLPKQQAKIILDNSVKEVFAPLNSLRFNGFVKTSAVLLVSVLTFVTRSVFLARLARMSTKTVQLSKVFASRATLVGALFLNLRWLAVLLLGVLYFWAFMILIFNLWWVC